MQRNRRETRTRASGRCLIHLTPNTDDADFECDIAPLETQASTAARQRMTEAQLAALPPSKRRSKRRKTSDEPRKGNDVSERPCSSPPPPEKECATPCAGDVLSTPHEHGNEGACEHISPTADHVHLPADEDNSIRTDFAPFTPPPVPESPPSHAGRNDTSSQPTQPINTHPSTNPSNPTPTVLCAQTPESSPITCNSDEEHDDGDGDEDPTLTCLATQLGHEEFPESHPPLEQVIPMRTRTFVDNTTAARPLQHASQNLSMLSDRMAQIVSRDRMLAYLMIAGHTGLTASQYETFRECIAGERRLQSGIALHPYKTIRRQMRGNLSTWCFPTSSIKLVEGTEQPRGARHIKKVLTDANVMKPALSCVRMVLPSEWAKLDVCTYTFYSDVYEHPSQATHEHLTIENAPIVQFRDAIIGKNPVLWSLFSGAPCVTKQWDTVDIPCAARPTPAEKNRSVDDDWFRADPSSDAPPQVRAMYCGSWITGEIPALGERRSQQPKPQGTDSWTAHEKALQAKFSTPSPTTAMENVLEREHDNQTRLGFSKNLIQLHPGDHCALLRMDSGPQSAGSEGPGRIARTQHCILIGSLVRQGLSHSAERLVWVDIDRHDSGRATVRYAGSSTVTDIPTWVRGRHGTPHTEYASDFKPRNMGFMQNGTRYLVYRVALYMDGFKQTKAQRDTRSVGGCYMLPLGLSLESRRRKAAPRVLALASSTVPHNNVLDLLLDDVTRAAVDGVDGTDPYGRPVRIFIDPVTFFGDYPAAALCADVLGHTGNAYCTHCTVARREAPSGASILSTPMNNSRRIGFMRTDARVRAIRGSSLQPELRRKIGLKTCDRDASEELPLVKLSTLLSRCTAEETDSDGHPIMPLMFDSSQSCAAVPDHMFNGLIKNMLLASFNSVPDDRRRAALEKTICSTARENGLPVSGTILRWAKDGTYTGLNNHTMTAFMGLLLCAAPAFEAEYKKTGKRVFGLARLLQNFASAVYFWPSQASDGTAHEEMYRTEGRIKYFADLRVMATDYLRACEKVMEEDARAGAILDKPNAHRAVELAIHTIPTFGHARNCCELVMESMHQAFKTWLERNPHQDSHITAVERALTTDWSGRVYALFKIWEGGTSRERACAELGLRRLLLGEEGMHLNERDHDASEFRRDFHGAIREAFRAPIITFMGRCPHLSLPRARTVTWKVHDSEELKDEDEEKLGAVFRKGRAVLTRHYGMRAGYNSDAFSAYTAARLVHSDMYEGAGVRRTYMHNEVSYGSVVSCPTAFNGEVVVEEVCGGGLMRFYAVLCVMRGPDGKLWAIAMPMLRAQSSRGGGMRASLRDVSVVQLCEAVRRAGAAHICDEQCVPHRRQLHVTHSARVCDGGLYELWTREHGYPPYMG